MPSLLPGVLAFVVGTAIGSFIGVIADRWPRREGVALGRSRCRSCGTVLGAGELVPLASFLAQGGRCRHCRAPIPADLVLAELGGGLVAVLALAVSSGPAMLLLLAGFGWALLLLGLLDARHFWLPNALTLPLCAAGLASGWWLPWPTLEDRGLGAIAGFLALEAVRIGYRHLRGREGLGAGDARLMAALGAWLGIAALPWVLLGAAMAGLAGAGLAMAAGRSVTAATRLPLGTALALAGLIAVPFVYP